MKNIVGNILNCPLPKPAMLRTSISPWEALLLGDHQKGLQQRAGPQPTTSPKQLQNWPVTSFFNAI